MSLLKLIKQYMQANDSEKNSVYIRSTISNIDKMSFIVVDRDGKEYKHFNKRIMMLKYLILCILKNQTDIIHLLIYIMIQTFYLWLIHFYFQYKWNKAEFSF